MEHARAEQWRRSGAHTGAPQRGRRCRCSATKHTGSAALRLRCGVAVLRYLLESDVVGVVPEASAADHHAVLPDHAVVVVAHAATEAGQRSGAQAREGADIDEGDSRALGAEQLRRRVQVERTSGVSPCRTSWSEPSTSPALPSRRGERRRRRRGGEGKRERSGREVGNQARGEEEVTSSCADDGGAVVAVGPTHGSSSGDGDGVRRMMRTISCPSADSQAQNALSSSGAQLLTFGAKPGWAEPPGDSQARSVSQQPRGSHTAELLCFRRWQSAEAVDSGGRSSTGRSESERQSREQS